MEKIQEAICLWDKSLRLNPNQPNVYFSRGSALVRLNCIERAISDFKKAISLDPNYADAYSSLGKAYMKINSMDEAFNAFEKSTKILHTNFESYFFMSAILFSKSIFSSAMEHINKCLSINPQFNYALYQKAKILVALGEIDSAEIVLEELKKIDIKLYDKFYRQ